MLRKKLYLSWICQIIAAIVMLQTLYFKFSGAGESLYIFSTLYIEPWGRYLSGFAELLASLLLLIPAFCRIGAWIGTLLMTGALAAHFSLLGIEVQGDHGYLFILCLLVLASCITILMIRSSWHRRPS